jgi:Tol biopolymer transport system component
MGTLGGDWAFIIRRSFQFTPGGQFEIGERAFDMLTLVPLNSTAPSKQEITVATFPSSIGRGVAPNNQLSAQFSPDGSRLVLSVALGPEGAEHLGLVILDLASGAVTELLSDPAYHYDTPAWSPDGAWIIYGRRSIVDGSNSSLWIGPPEPFHTQRGPLITASPGGRAYVYGWIDAGRVLVSRSQRYEVIEQIGVGGIPCTSCPPPDESLRSVGGLTIQDRDSADLRHLSPRFVGVFAEDRTGRATIEVADPPPGATLVRVNEPDASTRLFRPRWRPGTDDILFTREGTGDAPVSLVVSTRGGASVTVTRQSMSLYADWTPSGDEIVWVEGPSIASAIRIVRPDGTGVRVIHGDGGAPEGKIVTVDFGTVRF